MIEFMIYYNMIEEYFFEIEPQNSIGIRSKCQF